MTGGTGTGNTVSRLRHRMTLQQEVQASDGAGGYTRSWADVAELWGEIIPLTGTGSSMRGSGKETLFGDQIQAEISHRILLRYRCDITPAMRLVYETRLFNIRMVADVHEKRNTLQLLVQEGVAM
jgi:SPP1 family predicted phage head-tail adaptor